MRATLLLALVLLVGAPIAGRARRKQRGLPLAVHRDHARGGPLPLLHAAPARTGRALARPLARAAEDRPRRRGHGRRARVGVPRGHARGGAGYGRAHGVTLATLRRYIPRSSNPRCSAGFGMGASSCTGPRARAQRRTRRARGLPGPADALPRVHLHPRPRPRAHARVAWQARARGPRLPLPRSPRSRLRAGRVPRLLDLAPRRRRHDAAAQRDHVAAPDLRRPLLLRAPVLVPLLHRAAAGRAPRDGRRHQAHAPRPATAPAGGLRRRRVARARPTRSRRRTSVRASPVGTCSRACAASSCPRSSATPSDSGACSRAAPASARAPQRVTRGSAGR